MLKTISDFTLVAGPKVATGALTLGFNVWLLHIWSPEQYGLFAICTTAIMLTDAILGSSIDMATLRLSPNRREIDAPAAQETERAALQMKVLAVVASLPVVWLAARPLSQILFHQPGLEVLIASTMGGAVALLLLRSVLVHAQLRQRFHEYSLLEVIHSVFKFGGAGLLLLLSPKAAIESVLVFFAIGPLTAFGVGMAMFRGHLLCSLRLRRERMAELFRHAKWYALSGGIGNLVGRMDLFILSASASLGSAGIFAAGQSFASVPWLVASYLSVVLSPRILPHMEAGTCREFYLRVQIVLTAAAVLAIVLAITVMSSALELLPAAFRESADIFLILLAGNLVSFATFPVALPLVMLIRPRFVVLMDCIALPVLLALYSLAVSQGAIGVAWVTTTSLIVRGGLVQAFAWRLTGRACPTTVAPVGQIT
jgi:O-antigen/teichoic acid export membrane protein